MECPHCPDRSLVMADRQGTEIDDCPHCRGVCLDRGEFDKLIERAATAAPAADRITSTRSQPYFADSEYRGGCSHRGSHRKSRLGDLFD